MRRIKAVAFEPVGCLAEFSSEPFHELGLRVFGLEQTANRNGSEAYWDWIDWIGKADRQMNASEKEIAETLEVRAVEGAELYEDVVPALSQLKAMGIELLVASSLSSAAVDRFLDRSSVGEFFTSVWTRDSAAGVRSAPLARAIENASLEPKEVMFLVDTDASLQIANDLGTNSILMINDYDDGRRLAMHHPTGGVVSLIELPDFIRLVAENQQSPVQS